MERTQAMREANRDRAHEIYDQKLKSQVETPENIGKILSIDTRTGDYEMHEDHITAVKRLRARQPNAEVFTLRIGYNAVYTIGGTIERTTP